MPGHGESDTPDQKWMIEDVADDLALFIREDHLAPINYVGLSQVGMVRMCLAAKYPELVEKLILIGASVRPEHPERIEQWNYVRQSILEDDRDKLNTLFATLQGRILSQKWIADNPVEAEERQVMLSNDRRGRALSIEAAVLEQQMSVRCSLLLRLKR